MKIIFIRHAEPDYSIDSLTPQGWKEAEALSERVKKWNVKDFYVSPFGRAKDTASFSLQKTGKIATELPFMREFSYAINDPVTGRVGVPWDFVPSFWTTSECMLKRDDSFLDFPCIKENQEISKNYPKVIEGFDSLLKKYGYERSGLYYINKNAEDKFISSTVGPDDKIRNNGSDNEDTIVIFCHLGVICLVLSHLLNIPFEVMAHGFFLPTTSVTILSTEERWGKEAYFRVQSLGDTTHLHDANIPISPAGSFANPFQELN